MLITEQTQKPLDRIIYISIIVFCFLRPVFTLSYFVNTTLFGLKLIELYGIFFSYVFLVLFFVQFHKIRLNLSSLLLMQFLGYLILSLLWGSTLRDIARLVLPFTIFFITWNLNFSVEQVRTVLKSLVFGFLLPTIGSAYLIAQGLSGTKVIYHTGLVRYSGMFGGAHSIAHSMFILIFSISLLWYFSNRITGSDRLSKSRVMSSVLWSTLLVAVYNIYMSGTRTVFIGLVLYLVFFFIGYRKYLVPVLGAFFITIYAIVSGALRTLFFDIYEPLYGKGKIEDMGSGRYGGWSSMLDNFMDSPVTDQFLGLGSSVQSALTGTTSFGGAHNDFLDVLFCFGYLGIGFYFLLIIGLFFGIVNSYTDRKLKFIFTGLLFSVVVMNGLSNSYLTRFELSQYFMLLMGIFYSLKENSLSLRRSV